MDKKMILDAATIFAKHPIEDKAEIVAETVENIEMYCRVAFINGAAFALPKWIPVSERLPEKNTKNYGAHVLATDGKNIFTCTYTVGREIDIETESEDEEEYDFDEKRGMVFLKAGWYELAEQHRSIYDEIWIKRNPTHWMPLPELPNK